MSGPCLCLVPPMQRMFRYLKPGDSVMLKTRAHAGAPIEHLWLRVDGRTVLQGTYPDPELLKHYLYTGTVINGNNSHRAGTGLVFGIPHVWAAP